MATAASLLAAAIAVASLASPGWPRRAAKALLGFPATRQRAALAPEPQLFSRLAASQVGYGPAMVKQFSSPSRFEGFQVVREQDGAVAFQGGSPVRQVPADTLGQLRTVWIGDFTALTTPDGRFTILMPHPERVFRSVLFSWHPEGWPEDSPWMRIFRNARAWVE